jgi:hypothetical protein
VPIRGAVYGPECIPEVLEDVPGPIEPPAVVLPRGDLLAMLGFGAIVALSVLPWSRFGDASGALQAWVGHWSLVAVAAGLVGLAASAAFLRRPKDPRLEILVYLVLAGVAATAAYLHHGHPPPLSSPTGTPLFAMAAAALVAVAAALKWAAMLRARWARP